MATLQTKAVLEALARLGHATNLQLHEAVSAQIPDLSLTSVHRITARLLEREEIGAVPTSSRNVVLDIRPEIHDHFVCTRCAGVVDIVLPASTVESIQQQLGTHLAEGGLVIRGCCAYCRTPNTPANPPADVPAAT